MIVNLSMKNYTSEINKSLKLLNQIQKIRSKNNKNWMDILKLAIKLDYKNTSKLIEQIYKHDTQISKLARKIYKQ
jgi:hypothetical protein